MPFFQQDVLVVAADTDVLHFLYLCIFSEDEFLDTVMKNHIEKIFL